MPAEAVSGLEEGFDRRERPPVPGIRFLPVDDDPVPTLYDVAPGDWRNEFPPLDPWEVVKDSAYGALLAIVATASVILMGWLCAEGFKRYTPAITEFLKNLGSGL